MVGRPVAKYSDDRTPGGSHTGGGGSPGRERERGQRFERERRDALVALVGQGASVAAAARIVGVTQATVYRWLREGREPSGRREHRVFAAAYDEAEARCVAAVAHALHRRAQDESAAGVAAAKFILLARDARYGDRALVRRRVRAEAELAELKVEAARRALADGGASLAMFGLSAVLEGSLSEAARGELQTLLGAGGGIVGRRLGEDEGEG